MKVRILVSVTAISLLVALTMPRRAQARATEDMPQINVECTGWHALCSMATGCEVSGGYANCSCWRVTERHVVVVAFIKDDTFGWHVKEATQQQCTISHPCALDQAPVCKAIKSLLLSDKWVSDFSYRGWCENWKPVACNGVWSDCMTSPCSDDHDPNDPRPLKCQCTLRGADVNDAPYVGSDGTCNNPPGTVISTIPQNSWDFQRNMFSFPFPGNEYATTEACKQLKSDPQ